MSDQDELPTHTNDEELSTHIDEVPTIGKVLEDSLLAEKRSVIGPDSCTQHPVSLQLHLLLGFKFSTTYLNSARKSWCIEVIIVQHLESVSISFDIFDIHYL